MSEFYSTIVDHGRSGLWSVLMVWEATSLFISPGYVEAVEVAVGVVPTGMMVVGAAAVVASALSSAKASRRDSSRTLAVPTLRPALPVSSQGDLQVALRRTGFVLHRHMGSH